MSPYMLGGLLRSVMESGGVGPTMALLGFLVLAYFLREGVGLAKTYVASKDSERSELLGFIKMSQARIDESQRSFMDYCNGTTKILSDIATRVESSGRIQDARHAEIILGFQKTAEAHEEILKDLWRGRAKDL